MIRIRNSLILKKINKQNKKYDQNKKQSNLKKNK